MSGARPAAAGEPVDASVLMPVLNEEAHVARALEAALAQRGAGLLEVLVIDGRSTDATREVVEAATRRDPRVRLLDNPGRRTPSGLNVGLRAARGRHVVRMDAHTLYPPDYVVQGIRRLAAGDVDWVSGPQTPRGEGRWSRRVALALGTWLGVGGAAFRETAREIEVDTGFTGVWRRETVLAHGGWDEGWPVNQDAELAARIRAAGGRIVCIPQMRAHYVPRDSLRALARQYWRYGHYRAKTSRRHPSSMRRSHVLAPGLVLTALAAAAPGPAGRAAQVGLGAYGLAVAATCLGARRAGAPARDAAALAPVLAAMHLPWGAGFLAGCLRFGPPVGALARLAGLRRRR